ncbi:MAG: hypothetical protein K2Q01_06305 [Rickettsiales bacterium]|nr:hypothetical protein [Rickettsiales bacterium]
MTLNLPPVEDKVLPDSDGMPKWSKKSVKAFCMGRKQAFSDDFEQCIKKYGDDVGHKMTLAEHQELNQYRIQSEQKAVARAKKKKMHERRIEKEAEAELAPAKPD